MNPPRLLHLVTLNEVGGLERQVAKTLRGLPQAVNNTVVLPRGRLHPALEGQIGGDVTVIPWKHAGGWKLPRFPELVRSTFLRQRLPGEPFDVMISYSQLSPAPLFEALPPAIARRRMFYDHGASWYEDPETHGDQLRKYDRLWAVSRASRVMLKERFDLSDRPIDVVHNTLTRREYDRFGSVGASGGTEDEADSPGPPGAFRLLFVGRVIPHKGLNVLLRAMADLPEDVVALIVGEGRERDSMEALAGRLDLGDRVRFFGEREDLLPFYGAADLLVLPSVRESFGMVLLEAGAAGVPVVASRVDGIPDIVTSGDEGVLVSPSEPLGSYRDDWRDATFPEYVVGGEPRELRRPRFLDPDRLAGVIRDLRESEDRRRNMAEALDRRVRTRFVGEGGFKNFEERLGFSEDTVPPSRPKR